ncbi:MAG: c(7)-type cytochrome triheme domain-containing protein [Nitrospirota bacterium]
MRLRHGIERWVVGLPLLVAVGTVLPGGTKAQPPAPPPVGAPQSSADTDQERLQRIKEKLKSVDPSMVIYLDSRGNIAGTGDPGGVVGRAEIVGKGAHPPALELAGFPKDRYDLVDWAASVLQGKIKPRDAVDPSVPEVPPFDLDVVIITKSKFQPDVLFSHKVHTLWLACENCHEKIFKKKAGGNPEMHMTKIAAGQYCGRCHDRVAFPLTDCLRCHVLDKDRPK